MNTIENCGRIAVLFRDDLTISRNPGKKFQSFENAGRKNKNIEKRVEGSPRRIEITLKYLGLLANDFSLLNMLNGKLTIKTLFSWSLVCIGHHTQEDILLHRQCL